MKGMRIPIFLILLGLSLAVHNECSEKGFRKYLEKYPFKFEDDIEGYIAYTE